MKPGDIVTHRAGGPDMVLEGWRGGIFSTGAPVARCTWFDHLAGFYRVDYFPEIALEAVDFR